MRRAKIATVAEAEAAGPAQAIGVFRLFAMARRDDETILVIGDCEITMHDLDLGDREAGLRQCLAAVAFAELALAIIDAHGEHALKRGNDGCLRAGRE